jgi:co-chaperonin GroES (HSP10)
MTKPKFEVPDNFPTPRNNSVIVKMISQGTIETTSGVLLPEAVGNNANKPNVGIIYAVGADVPTDLQPGLKVYYNQYSDLEIMIDGYPYVMMYNTDVYCILKDSNFVKIAPKPAHEVRRGKKQAQQARWFSTDKKNELNLRDKNEQLGKKRIKKTPKKK